MSCLLPCLLKPRSLALLPDPSIWPAQPPRALALALPAFTHPALALALPALALILPALPARPRTSPSGHGAAPRPVPVKQPREHRGVGA